MSDRTAMEKISQALGVSGGVTRNALIDALDTFSDKDYAVSSSDIIKGNETKDPAQFIDDLVKIAGGEGYSRSTGITETPTKAILEFGVDLLTDPLTYLTGGIAGAGSKAAQVAAKSASTGVKLAGAAGAVGATYGALVPEEEMSLRFRNAVIGAGALALGGVGGVRLVGSLGKEVGNKTIDGLIKSFKPDSMSVLKEGLAASPSKQFEIGKNAINKYMPYAQKANEIAGAIVEGHGEEAVNAALANMRKIEDMYALKRNSIIKGMEKKTGKSVSQDTLNGINKKLNKEFEQYAIDNGLMSTAMMDIMKYNDEIVGMYNKARGSNITGIRFHTPQIADIDEFAEAASKSPIDGWVKRGTARGDEIGLTASEAFQDAGDRLMISMMDSEERAARSFMKKLAETPADTKAVEWAVSAYDKLLHRSKQSMLTMGLHWIKNNYYENVLRAYIQNGTASAVDVATDGIKLGVNKLSRGKFFKSDPMIKDVTAMLDPAAQTKYIKWADKTGLTDVAREFNVSSGGAFTDVLRQGTMSEAAIKARMGSKWLAQKKAEQEAKSGIRKAAGSILDWSGEHVGGYGRSLENSARIASFRHTIDRTATAGQKALIKKHGYRKALELDDSIRSVYGNAAKEVDKYFFDYGDLTLFEEKVMKRLFPFYSFFSKNASFWPEMIATKSKETINTLKAAHHAVGYDPTLTEYDRAGVPSYIRSGMPYGVSGNSVDTTPNISIIDFYNTVADPSSVFDKISPLIQSTKTIITGKDGLGMKAFPSDTRKQAKKATYNEKIYAYVADKLDMGGVYKDNEGNYILTRNDIPVLSTIQNAFPIPALGQIGDLLTAGDTATASEKLGNMLKPVKKRTYTDSQVGKTRGYYYKEKLNEKRKKRMKEVQAERASRSPSSIDLAMGEYDDVVQSFRDLAARSNVSPEERKARAIQQLIDNGWYQQQVAKQTQEVRQEAEEISTVSQDGVTLGSLTDEEASFESLHKRFKSLNRNVYAGIMKGLSGTGVPLDVALGIVSLESSGFKADSRNPKTGALGIFQFTEDTFDRIKKMYNLPDGDLRDPLYSTIAFTKLVDSNTKDYIRRMKANPSRFDIYMMHQQGSGKYLNSISNINAKAVKVFGDSEVGDNYYGNGDYRQLTVGEFYDHTKYLLTKKSKGLMKFS